MIRSYLRYLTIVVFFAWIALCSMRVWAATEGENAAQSSKAAGGGDSDYDQFLYLRHNETNGVALTDSLVLAKVTPKGFEQRDIFTKSNLHIAWNPLCVCDGVLYAVKLGDLIAINLSSGETELIASYFSSYAFESNTLFMFSHVEGDKTALRVFDFAKRCCREVSDIGLDFMTSYERPIHLSPDMKRLAAFTNVGDGQGRIVMGGDGPSKLRLIDPRDGRSSVVGPELFSLTYMTGGGDHNFGPPFIWLDPQTILLVHKLPGLMDSDLMAATLDVTTGNLTDLVPLPRKQWNYHEPYFMPLGKDSVPRIILGELGQYRIDVKQKQIAEDNFVGGDYRYTRGRKPERFHCGQSLLAEGDSMGNVSVSPDGCRAVWWIQKRTPVELSYHDTREGKVREVARGWLPTTWVSVEPSEGKSTIFWVSAKDMAPAAPTEPPQGWRRWTTGPYPKQPSSQTVEDKRPKVSDLFTLRISTDKKVYKLHAPIEITLALTNKAGRDVSFPRPKNFFPFLRATMKSNRISGNLMAFERNEAFFASDPVVVKAGETVRVSATVETEAIGDHKVEASIRSSEWQGELNAEPLTFVVEHSPEDAQLFKVKFVRLITICRAEFERDPMTCDYGRLLDLGPEMIPLLVAELNASDNPAYRQRMGYAMQRLATADALPYFEKLLRGDINFDGEMVLDSLQGMVQRKVGVEGALSLLFLALKHSNVEVRREAADRLRHINDPNVKDAMENAVEDEDDQTAMRAARYLAAYEGLDLAAWLSVAADKPTHAHYLAGRSIVKELEETWNINKGELPGTSWEEIAKSPEAAELFRRTLLSWQAWAKENQRTSEHFFDEDRKEWKTGKTGL
jgi:hypothetical protein